MYSIVNSTLDLSNSLFTKNRARASSAGLLYAQGGKLLLQQSMFLRNSVKLGGVVSLFSVDASIFNTTFENNEASGSNPKGGALYIACTSPCADTDVQTNITFSRFLYNSAKQGFGGGIYINAFPGHVNIDRSTFVGNVGLNGGGLSATSTVVRVRGSTFTNNFAYEGGGAVFWIYKNNFPTTLENVQNSNNQASYGPFKATDLTQLNTSFPIQMKQVSGSPITVPINVSLLDYYGQVIVNSTLYDSPSTTIYCSVYRDTGVIKGSSIVPSKRGVATFNQLVITGVPGQNTTLRFSVPISIIADTFQAVVFRTCIPGEITVKVGIGSNLASCQECTQGLYSFNPSDTVCNVCPTHATCPGGRILNLEKDYWRVDDNSATILPCPVPGVCLGGTNTTTQCQEGNTGPYCTVCAEGYTKSSSGNCYSCDSPSDTAGEILSTVLFVVILGLVGLAYKYRKSLVKYYTSKMKVAVKNRKLKSIRVKGKILVAFAQIVYQLGPAFNIVYPISYLRYLNFYSIFQLNLLLLPNVNCIVRANYYDGLVATTLSPFFIFVALAIGIQFMVLRAKRLNERNPSYTAQRSIQDTITVSFLISYFVLVNASTKVFQVFQCETFDNGQSFLVADYSIDCNAPDRSLYLSYGSLMILIYPLGIPLIYATILFRNRKLINPDWRKVIDSSEKSFVSNRIIQKEKIKVRGTYTEIKNIKNLYDSYTPKRWYFELFDCARRLCLGAVPVLIFRGSTLQIIIVLIISLFSVATFMHFSPYIHSHDNTLAVLAQWSITLVVISAMIIKVEAIEADGDHTDGLGVVLIFLNVAVIGVAIMSALLNTKETGDDDINGLFGGDEDEDDDDEEDEESQEKKKKDKAADGDEDLPSGDEDDDDDEQSLESDDEYSQKSPSKKTGAESEADDNYSRGQKQRSANLKGIFFQKSRQLSQTKSIREIEMNPLHNSPGRSKDVKTLDNPIRSRNSSLPFPSLSINDENQRGEAQSRSSQVQSSSIEDVSNTAQAFSRRPTEDQTVVERRSTANSNTGHIRTSFSVRDLPDSDDDEEY